MGLMTVMYEEVYGGVAEYQAWEVRPATLYP